MKRDSAYFFKFSNPKKHLCPLQLLSYALEIRLSIMELQWPEFLFYAYILIALVNIMENFIISD